MKFNRLIGLLAVFIIVVPMVSASSVGSGNSEAVLDFPQADESAARAGYMIKSGETHYHGYYVSPGTSSLLVDLNWFTDDFPLKLGIFRPDGSLYGYYYDEDGDDNLDGRIYLTISNPASGSWTFTVYGENVPGTWPYVFNVG